MKQKYRRVTYIDGTTELKPVRGRSDFVFDDSAPVRNHVKNRSLDRSGTVRTAFRTLHARRTPRKDTPYSVIPSALAFSFLSFGLFATYRGFDVRFNIIIYALCAAVVIAFDVMGLLGRFLARNTRLLISSCILLGVMNIMTVNERLALVSVIVCVIFLGLSYFLNSKWLDIENYDLSPEVQQALINSNESKAAKAWENGGFKKIRTLLWNLGNQFTDEELHGLYRPVFLVAYKMGLEKTQEAKAKLKKAENREEEQRKRAERLEQQLQEAQAETKQVYEQLQEEKEKSSLYLSQRNWAEKELETARAERDSLLAANSDLVEIMKSEAQEQAQQQAATKPEEKIELINGSIDDTIRHYLESGVGVTKTARLLEPLGVKRWKVAEISKTVERDSKIIPLKSATA